MTHYFLFCCHCCHLVHTHLLLLYLHSLSCASVLLACLGVSAVDVILSSSVGGSKFYHRLFPFYFLSLCFCFLSVLLFVLLVLFMVWCLSLQAQVQCKICSFCGFPLLQRGWCRCERHRFQCPVPFGYGSRCETRLQLSPCGWQ